jgi:hypothetical protein
MIVWRSCLAGSKFTLSGAGFVERTFSGLNRFRAGAATKRGLNGHCYPFAFTVTVPSMLFWPRN